MQIKAFRESNLKYSGNLKLLNILSKEDKKSFEYSQLYWQKFTFSFSFLHCVVSIEAPLPKHFAYMFIIG